MNEQLDLIKKWYESAEIGTPLRGDVCITEEEDGGHLVFVNKHDFNHEPFGLRILQRAPEPKPAWHDAVAVIAETDEHIRQVWERDSGGYWIGTEGCIVHARELRNVTPLIEQRVTDEARDGVWEELVHYRLIDPQEHRPSDAWTADVVHAALGLPVGGAA